MLIFHRSNITKWCSIKQSTQLWCLSVLWQMASRPSSINWQDMSLYCWIPQQYVVNWGASPSCLPRIYMAVVCLPLPECHKQGGCSDHYIRWYTTVKVLVTSWYSSSSPTTLVHDLTILSFCYLKPWYRQPIHNNFGSCLWSNHTWDWPYYSSQQTWGLCWGTH